MNNAEKRPETTQKLANKIIYKNNTDLPQLFVLLYKETNLFDIPQLFYQNVIVEQYKIRKSSHIIEQRYNIRSGIRIEVPKPDKAKVKHSFFLQNCIIASLLN